MYGYLHRGRVLSYDPATGGFDVTSVGLARTSRWGPVPSAVPGIKPNDRVILGATGTSRDDLVIIAKVGADFPAIDDIPGLAAALTALDGRTDVLEATDVAFDGRLDTLEAIDISLDSRLDTLEALSHVRMVSSLAAVTSPVSNQLVWLIPERRFYRWDSGASTPRWTLSAIPGQVIGGTRRITDATATVGGNELAVLDTGGRNYEVNSVYVVEAFISGQFSNAGNDFNFRIREGVNTAGTQWAQDVAPRSSDGYPFQKIVRFMRVTGGAESTGLSHAVTVQRVVGTGTCTVYAGSYITATYLGSLGFIDTV